MRGLFVHDPRDLDAPIPGGVQLCSREFLEVVRLASTEIKLLPVFVTRSPMWRLRRKLGLGSYLLYRPEDVRATMHRTLSDFTPTHVFLNRSELVRIAPLVTELAPTAKVILMSHGNQSGDDLYEVSGPGGRRSTGLRRLWATFQLGQDLVSESQFRHRHLYGVCAMSTEEEALERWLGATRTMVLPRIIEPASIDWEPVRGRVGYVGTLDHTANRLALERVCACLARHGSTALHVRLVGGPSAIANALARQYSFVQPLGRIDDDALRVEVRSWSIFMNPIFWLSRGASMKLARALSWGIPTVSTRAGTRGYALDSDIGWTTDDTPEDFAALLQGLASDFSSLREMRTKMLSRPLGPRAMDLADLLHARFG